MVAALYQNTVYHTWNTVVMSVVILFSCFLDMLDKLQKRICRSACPSLAASIEPLAHRRSITSVSLVV